MCGTVAVMGFVRDILMSPTVTIATYPCNCNSSCICTFGSVPTSSPRALLFPNISKHF